MIYLFFNFISIDRSKRHFVLKIYFLILICQSRVLNILLNSTIPRIELREVVMKTAFWDMLTEMRIFRKHTGVMIIIEVHNINRRNNYNKGYCMYYMDWIVECGQLYKVCAAFPEIVSCHVSAFVAGRQAAGWVAALQCCAECPSCSSTINASVNVMKSLHFPD